MEAFLNKKYKLHSSDKFDQYMKAVGKRLSTGYPYIIRTARRVQHNGRA